MRVDGTPRSHLEELPPHRLDLLLDHGPHVVPEDHGAHVLRRLDGREARDAGAEHQDAGGGELACVGTTLSRDA